MLVQNGPGHPFKQDLHPDVWHTRHRSVLNAMANLMAALAAYTIEPLRLSAIKLLEKKPLLIG